MRRINIKKTIAIVLACLLIIGAFGAVVNFAKNDSKRVSSLEFSRGGLDPVTGEYVKTDKTIYTKKAFECIGLRVEPDFESTVTFDVYYYDKNENLLDTKLGLSEVYDEDFPLAQYARIVIHPEIPEDVKEKDFKIKWNEVNKYAKMLKITVDKEQEYLYEDSINLYDPSKVLEGKTLKSGTSDVTTTELVDRTSTKVSKDIMVDGTYDFYDVYVLFETSAEDYAIVGVFDDSGALIYSDTTYAARNPFNFEKPIWVKMTIDVSKIENFDGVHLGIAMPIESDCYVYGYND